LTIFFIINGRNKDLPENELIDGVSNNVTNNLTENFKFIFEKDSVQTGENFDIAYSVQYLPENAQLLLYEYKNGLSRKAFGFASGEVNSMSVVHLHSFVDVKVTLKQISSMNLEFMFMK